MTNTRDGFVDKTINKTECISGYTTKEILEKRVKFCIAETAKEIIKYSIPNVMTSTDTSGEMTNRCRELLNQCGENK